MIDNLIANIYRKVSLTQEETNWNGLLLSLA